MQSGLLLAGSVLGSAGQGDRDLTSSRTTTYCSASRAWSIVANLIKDECKLARPTKARGILLSQNLLR